MAGTHGKTTTAAMLVHALRAAGLDPGWLVGGTIGRGLANGTLERRGEWLVVEADESDRSMLALDVEIALLTNVELEHHATYGSLDGAARGLQQFLGHARRAVVVWERPELLAWRVCASDSRGSCPTISRRLALDAGARAFSVARPRGRAGGAGRPQRARTPSAALEAARLAGRRGAARGRRRWPASRAPGGAFSSLGRSAAGALVYDDYAHHPTEVAATLAGARDARPRAAGRCLPAASVLAHARCSPAARRGAGAGADVVAVLDVYAARERAEEHPGVSGLMVAQAAADAAAGRAGLLAAATARRPSRVLRGLLGER